MAVRITVLASGSAGNSAVVSSGETSVLVDAGLSCRETVRRMRLAGEDPEKLTAILITHEHADHVYGLEVLARRLELPVYLTAATYTAWQRYARANSRRVRPAEPVAGRVMAAGAAAAGAAAQLALAPEETPEVATTAVATLRAQAAVDVAPAPAFSASPKLERMSARPELLYREHFESGTEFRIGSLDVTPFTIPHDAADPVGFVFRAEGLRIGFCTDLGYMPASVRQHLRGCDGLLIESNHDLEMLRGGPYPWAVKQRVMSRVGHLSNEALAEFFASDYDGGAAFLILAHLSEQNNHAEIARGSAERVLNTRRSLLHENRLLLAEQHQPLESVWL